MPGEIAAIYEAGGIGFRKAIGGLPILYFMTHSRTTHLKEGRRSEHRSPMSPCWQVPYRVANWVAGPLLPPKSKILLWEMVIVLSEAIIFLYISGNCNLQNSVGKDEGGDRKSWWPTVPWCFCPKSLSQCSLSWQQSRNSSGLVVRDSVSSCPSDSNIRGMCLSQFSKALLEKPLGITLDVGIWMWHLAGDLRWS